MAECNVKIDKYYVERDNKGKAWWEKSKQKIPNTWSTEENFWKNKIVEKWETITQTEIEKIMGARKIRGIRLYRLVGSVAGGSRTCMGCDLDKCEADICIIIVIY